MRIGQEIEQKRIDNNISILDVCNALLLSSESEYRDFVASRLKLSNIQIMGFMSVFHMPLESI